MKNANFARIVLFIFFGALTLSFYGCDKKETRGVTKNEIVLGTHTALSGPVAGWGIDASNAIRMRFEEANKAGGIHGRKIRYIVEDSQYRVPIAVQKANKLINRDKVFALVASLGTPMNNAVFKTQLPKNVPSLFPYTFARSMVEPHHRLKFAYASTYYDQIRAGLNYFVKSKGKKRICLMHQDTDFGEEIVEAVNDQLKVMNMKLLAKTSHKPTETNFVGSISKLRKANCDLIVLGTIIKDSIIPVVTARKMGWGVDMFGGTPTCNAIVANKGGAAVEGLYAVTGLEVMYEENATGRAKAFFANYNKRYNKIPAESAQTGYQIADITVTALQKAGKELAVDSFLKALESISSYTSIFDGPVRSFGPQKHKASSDSVLMVVEKGKWVFPDGKKLILSY